MIVGEALMPIRPDVDPARFAREVSSKVSPAVDRAGKDAGTALGQGMQKSSKASVAGLGKSLVAGLGLGIAVRAGIEELRSQEKVAAQTEAALKSTAGAANVLTEDVERNAEVMQDKAAIDAEVVQGAQNILLTFTEVRNELGRGNDVFDQAIGLAADLSVRFGTDLQSATLQLGKALNDPIKGVSALGRAGVQFSPQQKQMIEKLVETNDLLGAQKIVLKEVESQVGGSAAAYGDTLGGQLDKTIIALEDTAGSVLETFVPAIQTGTEILTPLLSVIQLIPPEALLAGAGLIGLAKAGQRLQAMSTVTGTLGALKGGLAGLGAAAGFLASPVGIGVTALASLAIGLQKTSEDAKQTEDRTQRVSEMLLSGERSVEGYTATLARLREETGRGSNISKAWEEGYELATQTIDRHLDRLKLMPGALDEHKLATIESMIEVDNLAGAVDYMAKIEERALEVIRRRGKVYEETNHDTERALSNSAYALGQFETANESAGRSVVDFAGLTGKKLREWEVEARENIAGVTQEFIDMGEDGTLSFEELEAGMREQLAAVRDFRENINTLIRKGASEDFIQSLVDMGDEGKQWAAALAGQNEKTIESFERSRNQVGKTSGAITRDLRGMGDSAVGAGGKVRGLNADLERLPGAIDVQLKVSGDDSVRIRLQTILDLSTQLERSLDRNVDNLGKI